MSPFAAALRKQRADAGFPSARAFYRARGAAFFRCTYKAYLDIEAGRSTPQPPLAMRIAEALGLRADPRRARAFTESYLRSLTGRPELSDLLITALSGKGPPAPLRRAVERSFSSRIRMPLTRRQAERVCSSPERYWTFALLLSSREGQTSSMLARRLGFKEPLIRAALRELTLLGLAAPGEDGTHYCPHTGKIVTYPRDKFYVSRYRDALRAHWDGLARARGEVLIERHRLLRASESALRGHFPVLVSSVYGANIYSSREPGPDTALFTVSAVARRLMTF